MTQPAISSPARRARGATLLRIIGIFKVAKAVLLIAAAISAFHLVHKDLAEEIVRWERLLHIAPGNRLVQDLVVRILTITKKQLIVLGFVLLAYAAMFLVEGTGLLLKQHWAEWMVVITTSGLIPLEVYEIYHRPTWVKAIAAAINVAVAIYLVVRLRLESKDLHRQIAISPS